MKRGKKNLIFLIVLLVLVLIINNISGTGFPPIPVTCSDTDIKAVWDFNFKESSDGITIFTNTTNSSKCEYFLAYKIKEGFLYILGGKNTLTTKNNYQKSNATQEYLNFITNQTAFNQNPDFQIGNIIEPGNMEYFYNRSNAFSDSTSIDAEFQDIFKTIPSNWESDSGYYSFSNNDADLRTNGVVLENISLSVLEISRVSCTPSWVGYNTSCQSNDLLTTYFIDSNNCNQTPASNQTFDCDYNNHKIIGNSSNINTQLTVGVYVNSSLLNLSQTFSGNQKIEFKVDGKTIIEGYFNFSSPLNLKKTFIERGTSSNKSYIIIKGIPMSKTIWINRVYNSTSICAKNSEISSISEISSSCQGNNESRVGCPATSSGISCEIDGDYYKVSGLTSSAVIEYITSATCTLNWNCTNFSVCANKIQTRTCVDLNHCNDTFSTPLLSQSCNLTNTNLSSSCSPNWQCNNWTSCLKSGNQTRDCSDKNSCNVTTTNKKTETKSCESKKTSTIGLIILITIWIVIAIAIILIFITIIYYINQSYRKPNADQLMYYK